MGPQLRPYPRIYVHIASWRFKAALKTLLLSRGLAEESPWGEALDCASPLALPYPSIHHARASSKSSETSNLSILKRQIESTAKGRRLPHSKTLPRQAPRIFRHSL
jgi:hypothetical protein